VDAWIARTYGVMHTVGANRSACRPFLLALARSSALVFVSRSSAVPHLRGSVRTRHEIRTRWELHPASPKGDPPRIGLVSPTVGQHCFRLAVRCRLRAGRLESVQRTATAKVGQARRPGPVQ